LLTNELKGIYRELSASLEGLLFGPPTAVVYNPLDYARDPAEQYLQRAGAGQKEVVFLGMNPGPWGMAQTGVPFGTVSFVRDWMGIEGRVGKPADEHPKRPIEGFGIQREEISGSRFWWFLERVVRPLANKIGFRSDFDFSQQILSHDWVSSTTIADSAIVRCNRLQVKLRGRRTCQGICTATRDF